MLLASRKTASELGYALTKSFQSMFAEIAKMVKEFVHTIRDIVRTVFTTRLLFCFTNKFAVACTAAPVHLMSLDAHDAYDLHPANIFCASVYLEYVVSPTEISLFSLSVLLFGYNTLETLPLCCLVTPLACQCESK